MKAVFFKYKLKFKNPIGTSRGVLNFKHAWFIKVSDAQKSGIGECALFPGLSCDDRPDFEAKLDWVCKNIHLGFETLMDELTEFPAIQFGLETALLDFQSDEPFILFPSKFTKGKAAIPINGLVWMGNADFMKTQIYSILASGFDCVKIKIGALDFATEFALIQSIREEYDVNTVAIRVDANGAFSANEALEKLKRLSDLQLHSIEQPIRSGQVDAMAKLCKESPLPIALDEELIGIHSVTKRRQMLQTINPKYIILKPALIGGFSGSQSWIDIAESQSIGWWVTSALESNIGLNAIAQWTYQLNVKRQQGLGTGTLFTNNINAPLEIKNGKLAYEPQYKWKINF